MRVSTLLSLACACSLLSNRAHAELPAPLPTGSHIALLPTEQARSLSASAGLRDEALRAVTLTLHKHGYDVLPVDQVDAALDGRVPDGCRDAVTCDPALALSTLGVDAVLSLAVWQRSSGQNQVVVYIATKQGYGQAERVIDPAHIAAAAADATTRALNDTLEKHEAQLQIESEPNGASVRIDQTLVGATPASLEITPGNHLISVESPGYVTSTRYVEIDARASAPVVEHIVLERAAEAPAPSPLTAANPPPPKREPPSAVGNYVIAAVLGAVAIPLLANALYSGAMSGRCDGKLDPQGHCGERATLGATFWTSLGLGLAAAGGSAFVLVVQPFTPSQESADSPGASARLELREHF